MLKAKRYRAEPMEPRGTIRTSVVSLNRLAWDLIGNPATVTLTSAGLDLFVMPGGATGARIYAPTGHATIRFDHTEFRGLLKPGVYRVGPGRHLGLKGVVFQGALLVERNWVSRT